MIGGAAVALAVLSLATSLCLLDPGDVDGKHATAPDPCLAMLAEWFAKPTLAGPLMAGWLVATPVVAPHAAALHVPDPPPEADSRA